MPPVESFKVGTIVISEFAPFQGPQVADTPLGKLILWGQDAHYWSQKNLNVWASNSSVPCLRGWALSTCPPPCPHPSSPRNIWQDTSKLLTCMGYGIVLVVWKNTSLDIWMPRAYAQPAISWTLPDQSVIKKMPPYMYFRPIWWGLLISWDALSLYQDKTSQHTY